MGRRQYVFAAAAVAASLLLVWATWLAFRSGRDDRESLDRQLDRQTALIRDLQDELTGDRDALACALDVAARTTLARAEYLSAIGDLVVVIATVDPGPDRDAAIDAAIETLDARNVEYRAAAEAEADYSAAGRPVPCTTLED